MSNTSLVEESRAARLYVRLLQLERAPEPWVLLEEVLELLVTESQAQLGYIELRSIDVEGQTLTFTTAAPRGLQPSIRSRISTTILERVIATGATYEGNADPDALEIEQVLAVAVGDRQAPRGVVYLQAHGGRLFDATDRRRVEIVAERLVVPLAWRLVGDRRSWRDVTVALQRGHLLDVLERCNGNKTAAARELGITRQRIHQLLAGMKISRR